MPMSNTAAASMEDLIGWFPLQTADKRVWLLRVLQS
jgi:hypothetical protein